ncbi:MAG: G/T mismatches repair enzyme [Candidatus Thorarchaeota archaeon]|nr:MAG: G/T mismatches repair enzyme [Candidatus Thorarchaeota archaeon]
MCTHRLSKERMNEIQSLIILWYNSAGRFFAWRNSSNPFHILIAEMMLRRTTAKAVEKVYPDFIRKYDTSAKLSSANLESITKLVSSLGLQNTRAQHLKSTAQILESDYEGIVPSEKKQLLALPGVGRYVASAVQNFAYHLPVPLVDGNVLHFLKRVFSLTFTGSDDPDAWNFMDLFGPPHPPEFYFGIIDLVAKICLRLNPRCDECPLFHSCDYNI